jgi:PAS domain-containing protein
MSTTSAAVQSQAQEKTQQTYDFTKRKRWADLLLTELADNIVLILSVSGKILYCGNAVTELLGWRDVDLIDVDFVTLVDGRCFLVARLFSDDNFSNGPAPVSYRLQRLFECKC